MYFLSVASEVRLPLGTIGQFWKALNMGTKVDWEYLMGVVTLGVEKAGFLGAALLVLVTCLEVGLVK